MRSLIAGVDPGTSVGFAVLNLNGEVVFVGSGKGIDLDSLISKFLGLGRVIAVGSDKAKVPSFVQDAAVKLGARVFCPSEDVRVDEKRGLTAGFSFNNAHEMDALASALLAFRKMKHLLNRARSFLEKEKRLGLFEDVVELVLKEEISIRSALSILTPKEIERVVEIAEEKRDDDVVHLYSALSRIRKDNSVLFEKKKMAENRLSALSQELAVLKQRISTLVRPKTNAEIARLKESQVLSLSNRFNNAVKLQDCLKSQIAVLENALLMQKTVPVVRLARLGWDEVERNRNFLGTVVFVDDCNQMSGKAVKFLYEKGVQLLICRVMPGKSARLHLPFACVPAPVCQIVNRVVLVDRVWLDKIRSSRVVLSQIVEEYKKQRSSV